MLSALDHGWVNFPGSLRQLGKLLTTKASAAKLQKELELGLPEAADCLPKEDKVWSQGLEFLSVTDRARILATLGWLLEDWPNKFVNVCKDVKLGAGCILDNREKEAPGWLSQVVTAELSMEHAPWRDRNRPKVEQISYETLAKRKFSNRLAAREDRLDFIRAWKGAPVNLENLAKAMRAAGLYSTKTCIWAIVKHLPKLVGAAQNPTEWWRQAGRPVGHIAIE